MDLLVLDTIHGGDEIAEALRTAGHSVDTVDVYRGTGGTIQQIPKSCHYDKIIVPVHLDPDNTILQQCSGVPLISHHEAVCWLITGSRPSPMVEITGARGKTTTAFAIAHILKGQGILHTSGGTYRYPGRQLLFRKSITPASILGLVRLPGAGNGWLIAEESLGVTGAGDLAIITSPGDYRCAAGKKSAFAIKSESVKSSPVFIAAPGVKTALSGAVRVEDHVSVRGTRCIFDLNGIAGSFENSLLDLPGYSSPLMTATAAGCMLGADPTLLETFTALPGRLVTTCESGHVVVDNSNTGTCYETSVDAARYARRVSGTNDLVLVIGQESHAVCEGFSQEDVISTIEKVKPGLVVLVGESFEDPDTESLIEKRSGPVCIAHAGSLEEGRDAAIALPGDACIVLAVKSWR